MHWLRIRSFFANFFFSLASAGLFLCPFLWLCLKLILYQNR
nr:MAG TPA: hypothetical protein [Caudoviricetes sp.]